MKILMVVPPIKDMYLTPHRMHSLGLQVAKEIFKENGIDAEILFFPGKRGRMQVLPKDMSYLKPFLHASEKGPTSFFTGLKHFGPSYESCCGTILSYKPDKVIVSCFAWAYAEESLLLIQKLKEKSPSLVVGAAGAGASILPEYFLTSADFIITGEAETILPKIISYWRSKKNMPLTPIPGYYSKNQGSPAALTDENNLRPAFSEVKEFKGTRTLSISLSRGCPAACRFCSNFLCHGRRFRTAPLALVEKKIKEIPDLEKPLIVNIEDDNLFYDKEYFYTVLSLFSRRFPQLKFMAENGLDYTLMKFSDLESLVTRGFAQMNFSLGNIVSSLQKNENRSVNLEKYETFSDYLNQKGVPLITYFISGLREDTPDKTINNLLYLKKQPTRIGISSFYNVPGLPDFPNKKDFLSISPGLCRGSSVYPWNKSLTTAEMVTAFRIARTINFLKDPSVESAYRELKISILNQKRLLSLKKESHKLGIFHPQEIDTTMEKAFFNA